MAEGRDPAIKLFGKTIKLPPVEECPVAAREDGGGDEGKASSNKEANYESKGKIEEAPNSPEEEKSDEQYTNEEKSDRDALSSEKNLKADKQQNEACNNPQEDEPNKKPDKILPCPRCKSMDTKFCYYNNYNANQPRHFCKKCQRYWTAGGSMRNVPVGAGRRKNKSSAGSHHYRHITNPDCVRADVPESIHHLGPLKPNGTVLSFGSDSPLCESMASVLNLVDKTMKDHNRDELHRDLNEELSSGSSVAASSSNEEGNRAANSNCHGFPPNVPYFNGATCPYPWSHSSPFSTTRIPIPFYQLTAYWGIPCPSQPLSTCPSSSSSCSGPNSLALGKHSREGDLLKNRNSHMVGSPKPEKCLWIPKTSRIDNPAKPANFSIWATMGFKKDKADLINGGGGLFKAFQSNGHIETHPAEVSQLLHAKPAALSRSISFQGSS